MMEEDKLKLDVARGIGVSKKAQLAVARLLLTEARAIAARRQAEVEYAIALEHEAQGHMEYYAKMNQCATSRLLDADFQIATIRNKLWNRGDRAIFTDPESDGASTFFFVEIDLTCA
jgi:hypothetical protein